MGTLKPHSKRTIRPIQQYDHWYTLATAKRGLGRLRPHPVPCLLYQM